VIIFLTMATFSSVTERPRNVMNSFMAPLYKIGWLNVRVFLFLLREVGRGNQDGLWTLFAILFNRDL